MFEKRVLRRISVDKGDEVTGGWKRLHIGKFMICTLTKYC